MRMLTKWHTKWRRHYESIKSIKRDITGSKKVNNTKFTTLFKQNTGDIWYQ